MQFVDREYELATLEREFQRSDGGLVVLYGRRRLGKTTLCRRFATGKNALYYLATEENEAANRNAFRLSAAEFLENPLLRDAAVDNWYTLFRLIAEAANPGRKTIIILDEFPYLTRANSSFPSMIQKIYDEILQPAGILLILCGSQVHMMEQQTLNYTSPLYGRRTAQIKLKPIPFQSYAKFYPAASKRELIELYSVTGGVPKYVELFQPQRDIFSMIERDILDPSSFLRVEPEFLLRAEVSEIGSYFSLIRTIAAGHQKLGKIASVMGIPQTRLTAYLRTLRDLDLVFRDVPVTETSPEKSKNGLYRLQDNFLRFWFRFVYPNVGYLESGHPETVMNRIRSNFADGHASFVFEDICRESLWDMSGAGYWPFNLQNVGRWWDKEHEIDIVAPGSDGEHILFGECKYWQEPVGLNVLEHLQVTADFVPWGPAQREEHFVLFSASGFTNELHHEAAMNNHVTLIDI